MRGRPLLAAARLLSACQKPSEIERAEYDRLQGRVTALEAQVVTLSAKRQAEPLPTLATQATPPKPQMTYQLIGTSFRDEGTFRYSTKGRCEDARQTLIENWATEDEQNRARGIVFTSRPTPACLPL